MKVIIDRHSLAAHLRRRRLSYQKLAENLLIHYRPTRRIVDEIRSGRVPKRWQSEVAKLIGVPAEEMYIDGRVKTEYLPHVQVAPVANIRIGHRISKAAISAWMSEDGDGGIEPEHLDALASFLGVKPIELVAPEVKAWMREFLSGGQASFTT